MVRTSFAEKKRKKKIRLKQCVSLRSKGRHNNKSAFVHEKFVDDAISELVESGCAKLVPFKPYIVPLSVALNKSVKPRLILRPVYSQ